jgi:hypothetical protein
MNAKGAILARRKRQLTGSRLGAVRGDEKQLGATA